MNTIAQAFKTVPRSYFLSDDEEESAGLDMPLPIGYGQTNSQPSTVRQMLEWLEVQQGDMILDVGSGSGWTTALLAYITGSTGFVYGVEVVPELVEIGRQNCNRVGVKNASIQEAGDTLGLPEHAPYDRILVSAATSKLPEELITQLKTGGRMVIPVEQSIYVIDKISQDEFEGYEYPGFVFVPLV